MNDGIFTIGEAMGIECSRKNVAIHAGDSADSSESVRGEAVRFNGRCLPFDLSPAP